MSVLASLYIYIEQFTLFPPSPNRVARHLLANQTEAAPALAPGPWIELLVACLDVEIEIT